MGNNIYKRNKVIMPERREFLLKAARGLGLAAAGGLVWGEFIVEGRQAAFVLRPPAALPEKQFLAACIRCGMCVEACPFDTLRIAKPEDGAPIGMPYFIPRTNPCYMCKDIPCVPACPTGALDRMLVSEGDEKGEPKMNINLAKMGLAVIDRETCIAYDGIQCDACYRTCPRIDKAITVEYTRNIRTGKHAMLAPVVSSDFCTGCGLCEKACVTEKASIFVLPRNIAMGRSGRRYVKGWDVHDEKKLRDVTEEEVMQTPRSSKNPVDYLNEDEL